MPPCFAATRHYLWPAHGNGRRLEATGRGGAGEGPWTHEDSSDVHGPGVVVVVPIANHDRSEAPGEDTHAWSSPDGNGRRLESNRPVE
jgi:hypothetical protein